MYVCMYVCMYVRMPTTMLLDYSVGPCAYYVQHLQCPTNIFIYIYIHDRWRVGPPPCLHCSFVVGVLLLVLSNCNSNNIGQLPVPIVAFRNFDENNRTPQTSKHQLALGW